MCFVTISFKCIDRQSINYFYNKFEYIQSSTIFLVTETTYCIIIIQLYLVSFFFFQITFDENLNFKTYILNKHSPMSRAAPETVKEMESLIEHFHNITVCTGGPRVALYKSIVLRSAYKDVCDRWRHNLCPLKTEGENTCKYCVRAYRTADTHYYVRKKPRMLRLSSSPSSKTKIDILRKTKQIRAQALHHNQVRLLHVRKELKTLSEKDFSRESFEEVINKYKKYNCHQFQEIIRI